VNALDVAISTNGVSRCSQEPHGANFDKHPNQAGQYLNALVFFTTLFGSSPVGAAGPLHTGKAPELPLSPVLLEGLQKVAHSVVLDHAQAWRVTPTAGM
jgi:hypothetical protein